jgi:hypothetical protein
VVRRLLRDSVPLHPGYDALATALTREYFDFRRAVEYAPFDSKVENAPKYAEGIVCRAHFHSLAQTLRRKLTREFARDLIEQRPGERLARGECAYASAIPKPIFRARFLESSLRPWLDSTRTKLSECRNDIPLANADFALCQRRAVRRLHLPRNLIVALFGGFADEFPLLQELVPVDTAGTFLAALGTSAFSIEFALPAFVDHGFSFLPLPFGLPPFLTHFRNVALSYFAARALPPLLPARFRNSRMILSLSCAIT